MQEIDDAGRRAREVIGLYGDPDTTWGIALELTFAEPLDRDGVAARLEQLTRTFPHLGAAPAVLAITGDWERQRENAAAAAYLPPAGRWADDAVIVLFGAGEAIVAAATVLLDVAEPRLLALAADEQAIDVAVAELREHLDGTGLISLEPGMAVEV